MADRQSRDGDLRMTVTISKCPCGHEFCKDYHLSIGKFVQGSGFSKEVAERIAGLLNGSDSKLREAEAREAVLVELIEKLEPMAHKYALLDGSGSVRSEAAALLGRVAKTLSSPSTAASALATRLADLERERDQYNALAATQKQRADDLGASLFIANTALPAARQNARTWQPIETAPLDETHVLLFTTCHGVVEAWFSKGEVTVDHEGLKDYTGDVWVCADDAFQIEVEICGPSPRDYHHGTATHWQPLPSPPEIVTASSPQGGEGQVP